MLRNDIFLCFLRVTPRGLRFSTRTTFLKESVDNLLGSCTLTVVLFFSFFLYITKHRSQSDRFTGSNDGVSVGQTFSHGLDTWLKFYCKDIKYCIVSKNRLEQRVKQRRLWCRRCIRASFRFPPYKNLSLVAEQNGNFHYYHHHCYYIWKALAARYRWFNGSGPMPSSGFRIF